jgi:hypothetical protein
MILEPQKFVKGVMKRKLLCENLQYFPVKLVAVLPECYTIQPIYVLLPL